MRIIRMEKPVFVTNSKQRSVNDKKMYFEKTIAAKNCRYSII
jgi:hypothetical protein